MSTSDIGRFGAGDGREAYYVQWSGYTSLGGAMYLRLVVIDEFGSYEPTSISKAFDPAAPTLNQAVRIRLTSWPNLVIRTRAFPWAFTRT